MSAEFESTLVKSGNSVGLALPKPIRDGMKLQPGDKLKIILQNNKICIEKIKWPNCIQVIVCALVIFALLTCKNAMLP